MAEGDSLGQVDAQRPLRVFAQTADPLGLVALSSFL